MNKVGVFGLRVVPNGVNATTAEWGGGGAPLYRPGTGSLLRRGPTALPEIYTITLQRGSRSAIVSVLGDKIKCQITVSKMFRL